MGEFITCWTADAKVRDELVQASIPFILFRHFASASPLQVYRKYMAGAQFLFCASLIAVDRLECPLLWPIGPFVVQ